LLSCFLWCQENVESIISILEEFSRKTDSTVFLFPDSVDLGKRVYIDVGNISAERIPSELAKQLRVPVTLGNGLLRIGSLEKRRQTAMREGRETSITNIATKANNICLELLSALSNEELATLSNGYGMDLAGLSPEQQKRIADILSYGVGITHGEHGANGMDTYSSCVYVWLVPTVTLLGPSSLHGEELELFMPEIHLGFAKKKGNSHVFNPLSIERGIGILYEMTSQ